MAEMQAMLMDKSGVYERTVATTAPPPKRIRLPVANGYNYTHDGMPVGINFDFREFEIIGEVDGLPVYMEVDE